jgi:uncharacterized protein YndB with AHSA1/START domain
VIPDIVFVEELPHSIEKVWAALTDPADLADWLMPNDFEPRLGQRFSLQCPPAPDRRGWIECVVLELDPPLRMVWSWAAAADTEPSQVAFRLEPIASGTRLTLTHSREPNAGERQRFAGGWVEKLANLRGRLAAATGQRLPAER